MATRPAQLRQFLSKAELLFQISLTHTNSKRSVRYDMTHFKTTPVILNKSLRTLSWRSDQQYQTRPQCTVFRVCFGCVQCVCVCVCVYVPWSCCSAEPEADLEAAPSHWRWQSWQPWLQTSWWRFWAESWRRAGETVEHPPVPGSAQSTQGEQKTRLVLHTEKLNFINLLSPGVIPNIPAGKWRAQS